MTGGAAPRTRPTGVTILAVLAAIVGVLSLLGGLAVVGLGGAAGAATGQAGLGALVAILGLVALVLGALYLAFAYGAWQLRPWAWSLGVAIAAVGIVLAILDLLGGNRDILSVIVSVLFNGAILYYLNTPEVRQAFSRPATGWR